MSSNLDLGSANIILQLGRESVVLPAIFLLGSKISPGINCKVNRTLIGFECLVVTIGRACSLGGANLDYIKSCIDSGRTDIDNECEGVANTKMQLSGIQHFWSDVFVCPAMQSDWQLQRAAQIFANIIDL